MNVYRNTSKRTQLYEVKKQINFSHLHWDKIFLRVNRLIKQVYYETKKHSMRCAHQLQMYIINSIELKIFVFKYVVLELYRLYYLDKNIKYRFDQRYKKQKVKIKSQNQQINLRKILKQHLIYICTKPMFDARLPRSYKQTCILKKNKFCITKDNYYYYQNIKYIEKKLELPTHIKENILYCIETLSYVDILKFYKSKYKFNINNIEYLDYVDCLKYKSFLNNILDILNLTDCMWYKFNCIKKVKHQIKMLDDNSLNISKSIKSFKYSLKFRFLLSDIRFSRYLELKKKQNCLVSRLSSVYENLYNTTDQFINLSSTSIYNHIINQTICSWIKKQDFGILSNTKNTSIVNMSVNKKTYICNLRKYYVYTV